MKRIVLIFGVLLFVITTIKNKKFKNCDFIIYNKCVSCNIPYAFEVGFRENCTKVCPNRDILTDGTGYYSRNFCFLKHCPNNKPYRDHDGSCYEDENHIPRWDNQYKGFYSMFSDVNIDKVKPVFADNGRCPHEAPLLQQNECFSCSETENLTISEEECNKCPNRKYVYSKQLERGECTLPCPSNKPLKRWDGVCFDCKEEKVITLETLCNFDIDCNVCPNRTIIRAIGGNIPSVINCPPDRPLIDAHGVCYSCDTTQDVDVRWNSSLCNKICPNRYLNTVNDSCVLNGVKFE